MSKLYKARDMYALMAFCLVMGGTVGWNWNGLHRDIEAKLANTAPPAPPPDPCEQFKPDSKGWIRYPTGKTPAKCQPVAGPSPDHWHQNLRAIIFRDGEMCVWPKDDSFAMCKKNAMSEVPDDDYPY